MVSPTPRNGSNGTVNLEPDVFMAEPLNSVPPPYAGQPMPHMNTVPTYAGQRLPQHSFSSSDSPFLSPHNQFPSSVGRPTEALTDPAMIFLPENSPQELENLLRVTKNGVALTGSAAIGHIGPAIGKMDIGESADSYFFRVSLPGVSQEQNFSCDVKAGGEVMIKGVTITGERVVRRDSQVFVMKTQNFCPPGEFSISFQLPGPVDHKQFTGNLQDDGILVCTVKKRLENSALTEDEQMGLTDTS